jgi:hypothetical protein
LINIWSKKETFYNESVSQYFEIPNNNLAMHKYILTIIGIIFLLKTNAQTFYNLVVKDYPLENKTFLMNADNCDSQKIYTCLPTNNLSEFYENVYYDIAIDTNQNIYYISPRGSLYMRNLKDTTSCQFLGTFGLNGNEINSLEVDLDENLYASGNLGSSSDGSALYKYTAKTHVFSTVGKFPPNMLSGGDLFFYEGTLFLAAYDSYDNDSTSFLVNVNVSDPSLSCRYMDLPVAAPWGAFSIKYSSYSKAFIIVPGISSNSYISTMYEVDIPSKKISQPVCTYPYAILGSASLYNFTPSFLTRACNTLPVTLMKFSYTINKNLVELTWETATETSRSFFK